MSTLKEQLEREVEEYNQLAKNIEAAEQERLKRLGRIGLLQEQVEKDEPEAVEGEVVT